MIDNADVICVLMVLKYTPTKLWFQQWLIMICMSIREKGLQI